MFHRQKSLIVIVLHEVIMLYAGVFGGLRKVEDGQCAPLPLLQEEVATPDPSSHHA